MLQALKAPLTVAVALAAAALTACGGDPSEATSDAAAPRSGDAAPADAALPTPPEMGMPDAAIPDAALLGPGECAPRPELPCEGDSPGARPGRLNEHTAVYDPDRNEMLIFGGNDAVPENCGIPTYTFTDALWVYRDHASTCAQWAMLSPADGPSARGRHAAVFGDGAMWVFGGRERTRAGSYALADGLWRFDSATRTWSERSLDGGPSLRMNHAMAYDSRRNALVVFGGNASGSAANVALDTDVWSYDIAGDRWERLRTMGREPAARLMHTAFYDGQRDRLVVFGGADENLFSNSARYFSDLWALDLQALEWTPLSDGAAFDVPGRFWGAMTYDSGADRYVLFGGHDDQALGNRNDTWVYDPSDDTWSNLFAGDAFSKPANGVCDFPPDFATVDVSQPERRNAHSLVWSPCGHALLFGGKTDCGAINDVWRLTGVEWAEAQSADEGEACLRFRANPDNCANLCF